MFFFSSRRRHTRLQGDWSSDVCSSDLIREELRRTIRQVQRELGITTVLVTHDQEEAFAMADRIGVMNLGRLLEMGAPHDRSEEHTSELQSPCNLVCRLLLEKKKK